MQEETYEALPEEDNTEEPATKRPRENSPQLPANIEPIPTTWNINYLVYEIERTMVHTFRSLLLTDGVATATRPILHHDKAALMISFKNWEEVARFYEWSCRGNYTRFLTTALRIPCGSINGNMDPFMTAKDMLEVYQEDSTVTQYDVDEQFLFEEDAEGMPQEGHEKFHLYLLHGVLCDHCQCHHRPFRPSH